MRIPLSFPLPSRLLDGDSALCTLGTQAGIPIGMPLRASLLWDHPNAMLMTKVKD